MPPKRIQAAGSMPPFALFVAVWVLKTLSSSVAMMATEVQGTSVLVGKKPAAWATEKRVTGGAQHGGAVTAVRVAVARETETALGVAAEEGAETVMTVREYKARKMGRRVVQETVEVERTTHMPCICARLHSSTVLGYKCLEVKPQGKRRDRAKKKGGDFGQDSL